MIAVIGHLIKTAFRAFWHIVITAAICALLAIGVVMFVLYHYTQQVQWPPRDQLTLVALIAVAALSAYAGGVTALMTAAVHALKDTASLVEKEAVAPLQAVERKLEGDKR